MHDYAQAREILLPLADNGNADAQLLLGRMQARGEGGAADAREAARWYERAAEQGRAEAQIALGTMHADGDVVAADDAQALHWLRRAAEQNMPDAMNAVGELLLRSASPQMRAEAHIWFLRAARLDNARALYHLGQIHAFGSGVRQDDIEAYKWFDLAASAGPGPERDAATRALMTLRERMTPMQVAWADLLGRVLVPHTNRGGVRRDDHHRIGARVMSDFAAGASPQVWSYAASAFALARAGWRRFVAALQASRRREAAILLQRHRDLIAPATAPAAIKAAGMPAERTSAVRSAGLKL